jgi:hypothetical protein
MLSQPLLVAAGLPSAFDNLAIRGGVGCTLASSLHGVPRDGRPSGARWRMISWLPALRTVFSKRMRLQLHRERLASYT